MERIDKHMDKKELIDGYMSIKEFSEQVEMPKSTLRHYDKIGVFRPFKRGFGAKNGYRYYSPEQITAIKMVGVLTEIGVSLETIKDLQERTPADMILLLNEIKENIHTKIGLIQEDLAIIDTFMELISEGISVNESEISVRLMPEKRLILGDENVFDEPDDFYREFSRFRKIPYDPPMNTSYPVGGYWPSMAEFLEQPSLPVYFFSFDPKGNERRPEGLYITGYTRGYYGQTGDLPQRIVEFAEKDGLSFDGEVFGIYLFDEISMTDPNQYLLQICAAVKEARPTERPFLLFSSRVKAALTPKSQKKFFGKTRQTLK
jgi:DNA-binding transcriptional MerR regulator